MNNLKAQLNINEKYTKVIQRSKNFNKVKDNIPLVEDLNFMADLLFLPTDVFGYKYLLAVVDLATHEFDIEAIKSKEPIYILKAFEKMVARDFINMPKSSIATDGGSEFKGVFHKYLYDNDILHKQTLPGRHKQLSSIDNLNRQLGALLNGYMNSTELRTGKVSKSWTPVVPLIRKELNKIRLQKLPEDIYDYNYPSFDSSMIKVKKENTKKLKKEDKKDKENNEGQEKDDNNIEEAEYYFFPPKFKVNDRVYVALDRPKNVLGKTQSGKFREGDFRLDTQARRILKILYYTGKISYRYLVEGIPNVSYTEQELKKV